MESMGDKNRGYPLDSIAAVMAKVIITVLSPGKSASLEKDTWRLSARFLSDSFAGSRAKQVNIQIRHRYLDPHINDRNATFRIMFRHTSLWGHAN